MKLITAEIKRKLEKYPIGSQDGLGKDAKVLVKFFGGAACTWLVLEAEKYGENDWLFYGLVSLGMGCWEYGEFLLSDLQGLRFPPFGLPIERDMYLGNVTVGDLVK